MRNAAEHLIGIVTGMVADNQLHELEVRFLHEWLAVNRDVAHQWPGRAIAEQVRAILRDGVVDENEAQQLLATLKKISAIDFAETGSAEQETIALPIDNEIPIELVGSHVCFTGTFLYGTRTACERRATLTGSIPLPRVTSQLRFLIVGTNVAAEWHQTPFGNKIEAVIGLQAKGYPVAIVTEKRWLEACGPLLEFEK